MSLGGFKIQMKLGHHPNLICRRGINASPGCLRIRSVWDSLCYSMIITHLLTTFTLSTVSYTGMELPDSSITEHTDNPILLGRRSSNEQDSLPASLPFQPSHHLPLPIPSFPSTHLLPPHSPFLGPPASFLLNLWIPLVLEQVGCFLILLCLLTPIWWLDHLLQNCPTSRYSPT